MSKFLQCKNICPVVSGLREENELLRANLAAEKKRTNRLVQAKRENEKRLAKIRQCAFGIVDWGIDVE